MTEVKVVIIDGVTLADHDDLVSAAEWTAHDLLKGLVKVPQYMETYVEEESGRVYMYTLADGVYIDSRWVL